MKTSVERLIPMAALLILVSCAAQVGISESAPASEEFRTPGLRFIDGLRGEFGKVRPDKADEVPIYGVNLNCGTLFWHRLDWTNGVRYWSSSIKPKEFDGAEGDIDALGIHSDLNWHLFRFLGLRPYLTGGLGLHYSNADIAANPELSDDLTGSAVGLDYGFGIATGRRGVNLRAEVRREEVENLQNWNATIGIGWWPRADAVGMPDVDASAKTAAPEGAPTPTPATTTTTTSTGAAPAVAATAAVAGAANIAETTDVPTLQSEVSRLSAENAQLRSELAAVKATAAPVDSASGQAVATPPPAAQSRSELRATAFQRYAEMSAVPDSTSRTPSGGVVYSTESFLTFVSGSGLDTRARDEIRRLAVLLLMYPETRLSIQGHGDNQGSKARNQEVSRQRAEVVRQELVRLGVSSDRIEVTGVGADRPVADNATPAGRAANRRVSIIVTGEDR
jgi:outer membrane protein OmpA-like peptidoglycan-associated protein